MPEIVCISGTNRQKNYTSRALQIVIDEINKNNATPVVFDAKDLSLAFAGQKNTDDSISILRL